MPSEDANKELIRRFYEEVWNRGNTRFALEVFADDYVRHDLRPTGSAPGGAGQSKIAADFRAAFPDLVFRPELLIAEGDYVAARWTASAVLHPAQPGRATRRSAARRGAALRSSRGLGWGRPPTLHVVRSSSSIGLPGDVR